MYCQLFRDPPGEGFDGLTYGGDPLTSSLAAVPTILVGIRGPRLSREPPPSTSSAVVVAGIV